MHCPYLKDINFTKINKLNIKDHFIDDSDSVDLKRQSTSQIENIDEVDEDNDIYQKMKSNTMFIKKDLQNTPPDFDSDLSGLVQRRLSQHQILEIKISDYALKDYSSEEFSQNCSEQSSRISNIHSFISNNNALTKNINIGNVMIISGFRGQVKLVSVNGRPYQEAKSYKCDVRNFHIRIKQEDQKIKFFIDMHKYKIAYRLENKCTLALVVQGTQICQIKIKTEERENLCFVLDYYLNLLPKDIHSLRSLSLDIQTISFSTLFKQADTFDLLLFKNRNFMSKMQRFFTNSNFDHVAMILRSNTQELYVFECTSTYGVGIYLLKSYSKLQCSKYYERICYRKLSYAKSYHNIEKLEKFIKESVGKKYKFDPVYLLKQQKTQQESQTYFCSDLIARALQEAQILDDTIPSMKYLPKHFCDEQHLLIKAGEYKPSVIIEFNSD